MSYETMLNTLNRCATNDFIFLNAAHILLVLHYRVTAGKNDVYNLLSIIANTMNIDAEVIIYGTILATRLSSRSLGETLINTLVCFQLAFDFLCDRGSNIEDWAATVLLTPRIFISFQRKIIKHLRWNLYVCNAEYLQFCRRLDLTMRKLILSGIKVERDAQLCYHTL